MSAAAIVPSSRRQFRRWSASGGWARVPLPRLAEARARISEREQVGPLRTREWDDGDLSYDDGWCDEPECPVCASVEIRTPRLTCPLLTGAARL